MSDADSSSKRTVAVIVAVVLGVSLAWGSATIWLSGGIDPVRAREVAERAERECVLAGIRPRRCQRIVGHHHRECLAEGGGDAASASDDGDGAYLRCMKEHFDRASQKSTPADSTSETEGSRGDSTH